MVLGLLSRGQRHGYDLKREHDERFPAARPLAYGQVYTTLDRLHRRGQVSPLAVQRVDGPDRTVYEITEEGRSELEEWLRAIEEPVPHPANPFATKMTVALLLGRDAVATRYLRAQRTAHLDRMRELTKTKTDPAASLQKVLAADYALAHLKADLRWMEAALQRVAALKEELGP